MLEMANITIELEIPINASKKNVWQAIIEVDSWWLADFRAIPDSRIKLEPGAGGRLYETGSDGAEGLWYTITGFYPEQSLELVGNLRPEHGGPAISMLKLTLLEKNEVTVLQVSDCLFGCVNPKTQNNIYVGWKQLFSEGLKKVVEMTGA